MLKKIFLVLIGGLLCSLIACSPTFHQDSPTVETGPVLVATFTVETEYGADDGLTEAEISTLQSLEQLDDYPLYQMNFYADYEIAGAYQSFPERTQKIEDADSWACSLFTALADPEARIYGRNFDWEFSPGLILYTNPPDAYASVSMVDMAYLGFAGSRSENLTESPISELTGLLEAPFLPFDGLNETGLAIGMAAVPPGNVPADPNKTTLGSLGVIRAVLDQAATVDEALQILQRFNIDFEGGPSIHYLIADRQGQAALLEHQGGQVHILRKDKSWHQATNFLNSAVSSQAGNCWRYDTIHQELETHYGILTPEAALNLLQDVAQDNTQWSIVYGMSDGEIFVALGGDYRTIHNLQLDILE